MNMADKRQSSRRSASSGKQQNSSQRQPVSRQTSAGKTPVSQKQTPSRRPDMIRCENCGEDYSSTYKRCPFCDERPGRTGIGGRRVAGAAGRQVHPIQMVGLVISLILIIAALFIVITRIAPLLTGGSSAGSSVSTSQSSTDGSDASGSDTSGSDISSSGDASSSGSTSGLPDGSAGQSQGEVGATVTSITLNKTDMTLQPGETTQITATLAPAGATGTVTWSSSDTTLATVDEYGNVKNVNQGTEKKKAVITASCGTVTFTCDVHCKPANESSGSGTSTGGNSGTSTGTTSGPVAANTPGTIVNAGSGLNVRSGPGSSYDKVASIKNGNKVIILEDAGSGWYKVDIGGGVTGYISSDYVSVG